MTIVHATAKHPWKVFKECALTLIIRGIRLDDAVVVVVGPVVVLHRL